MILKLKGSSKEEIKINLFMQIWEIFNSINYFSELEISYLHPTYLKYKETKYIDIIKEVYYDFYSVNNVELNIQNHKFIKKINNLNDNLYINFLIRHILKIKKKFVYLKDRKDMLILKHQDLNYLLNILMNINDLKSKENILILKNSIKKVFNLNHRDAIFIFNKKLYIKYFNTQKGKEKRFNGIPEEELKILLDKIKEEQLNKILIENINQLMTNQLNLKKIDNLTFHTNIIKLIQSLLNKKFKKIITQEEVLKGFINYLLRKKFEFIMSIIVEYIYVLIIEKENNMINFINFYDGKEIIFKNKNIIKPKLLINKKIYSYNIVYNLIKLFNQKKKDKEQIENTHLKIEKSMNELKDKLNHLELESIKNEKELALLILEADNNFNLLKTKQEILLEKKRNKKNVEELLKEILELENKDKNILTQRNKITSFVEKQDFFINDTKNKILTLTQNKSIILNKIDNINKELEEIEKEKNLFKNELIKIFIQFKG